MTSLPPFDTSRSLLDQITARRLNDIQRAIPKIRFSGGSTRISNFGNQVFVQIPKQIGIATSSVNTPFQIFAVKHLVSGIWDGTYDVTLYPGTVNEILPTNIFDTINQAITDTVYVILTCTSDGYAVTSCLWSLESSMPTPPDATADIPPSSFSILIGVIFYNSGPMTITTYQVLNHNVAATPAEWTRTSRPMPEPFALSYQIYYYWNIQNGTS